MTAAQATHTEARRDVPDAVKPPPGNPRFPLVDGVRAVAVLMVVAFHSAQTWAYAGRCFPVRRSCHPVIFSRYVTHLVVGVTIFFVLSGFLLYRPFVAARLAGAPRPRVLAYARRRALRILPAYWLALTALAIYPGLVGVFSHEWWVYYGFVQVYREAWVGYFQGLVQAWSLCTEVAFYVALPFLAFGIAGVLNRTRRQGISHELAMLTLLALAALVFRAYTFKHQPFPRSEWLLGEFDWFVLGMALAVVHAASAHLSELPRPFRAAARYPGGCWVIALALFVLVGWINRRDPGNLLVSQRVWLSAHVLYGAVALFVVLPAVFADGPGSPVTRFLGSRVMAWLGLISYGIFLWHVTILTQLRAWGVTTFVSSFNFVFIFVVALVVTVFIAAISYYAVERPLLRLKERRRPVGGTG